MSMKASTRQMGDVTIVDLNGQIKLGEGSSVLRDTVKGLLGKGQKRILLNLGGISYIDSSGIGELVSAFTSVRNQGGEMKLLHLTNKTHDLLQITKLYTVFHVLDDEKAAIAAFGSQFINPVENRIPGDEGLPKSHCAELFRFAGQPSRRALSQEL